MTDEARQYREIQRRLWVTAAAHRDAVARDALVRRHLTGEGGWYSVRQYMDMNGTPQRVPLAMPDFACPLAVRLRHPAPSPAAARPPRTPRRALLRRLKATNAHRGRAGFVCPVLEYKRQVWTCIAALASFQLFTPEPVVVGAGIDTLELHTKAPVGPVVEALLSGVFSRASDTGESQPFELGGVAWSMHPRLIKGGWKCANLSNDVVVRVRADAEPDEATVIVELHAAVLWAMGWRAAGDLAERVMAAVCVGAELDVQVTRVDLCVDWQGWQLTPEDRERFTSRAKKRGRFFESHIEPRWDEAGWLESEKKRVAGLSKQLARAESLEEVRRLLEVLHQAPEERVTLAEYDTGKHAFTGFAFGLGHHVSARSYNKSKEIRRSRKGWFHAVWSKCPGYRMPPGGSVDGKVRDWFDVWRLEFQLRREALKEFIQNPGGEWEDLSSWRNCRARLDDVWSYLTKHWLRHGWRTAEDRLAVSKSWKALRDVRFTSEPVADLARVIAECGVKPVLANVAGYLTTAVAQRLELDDEKAGETLDEQPGGYSAMIAAVCLAAEQQSQEKEKPLHDVIEQKREAIRHRAAFLARKSTREVDERRHRIAQAQRYATHEGITTKWEEIDDRHEALSAVWRAEQAHLAAEANREALRKAEREYARSLGEAF